MLDILGIIIFTIPLITLWYYNYKYGYNHALIKNYRIRDWIPKNEINHHINNINQEYFINLQLINFNQQEILDYSDLKYDYYDDDNPKTSHEKFVDQLLRIIFSGTVSLSIELIILILCELIDYGNFITFLFHLIIDSLTLLLSVILPFLITSLIINSSIYPTASSPMQNKVLTGVLYLLWFFILSSFGSLSAGLAKHAGSTSLISRDIVDIKITQISLLGIVINSVLSGIGSSTLIYKLLLEYGRESSEYNSEIQEIQLNNLISAYNNLTKIIDKRNFELNDKLVRSGGTIYNTPSNSSPMIMKWGNHSFDDYDDFHNNGLQNKKNKLGGIIHKVQSFASLNSLNTLQQNNTLNNEDDIEIHELKEEIKSLNRSKVELYNKLNKMMYKFENFHKNKDNQSIQQVSEKASKILNYGFAIYCIYRILNIVFIKLPFYYLTEEIEAEESKDAIAITVSKILKTLIPSIQLTDKQLINLTSFLISGSLFLLTFTNVLNTLRSFGRFFPIIINLSKLTKNWLKNLIICQLLGVFVISTCLLIRTNLPSNLSYQISKILSLTGSSVDSELLYKKEVKFIDKLFDLIYLLSFAVTFAQFGYRFVSNDRYNDDEIDEEEMIEDFKEHKVL